MPDTQPPRDIQGTARRYQVLHRCFWKVLPACAGHCGANAKVLRILAFVRRNSDVLSGTESSSKSIAASRALRHLVIVLQPSWQSPDSFPPEFNRARLEQLDAFGTAAHVVTDVTQREAEQE